MISKRLNRRAILGSVGSAAVTAGLAPFLPKNVWAQGGATPKRFLAIFTTQGWTHEHFFPKAGSTPNNWQLGDSFKPAERFKEHITVLDGLECYGMHYSLAGKHSKDNEHGWGTVIHFTGAWPQSDKYGGGQSIDQFVADRIWQESNGKLPFKHLAVGVGTNKGHKGHPFYTAAGQGVAKEENPAALFTRVFGDFMVPDQNVDPLAIERLRAQKRTVLDLVKKQVDEVRGKIARPLRANLDDHLDAIQQMEAKVFAGIEAPSASCSKPTAPVSGSGGSDDGARIRSQIDMLASAFACDLTRVGIMQWGHGDGGVANGHGLNHHNAAHGVATKDVVTPNAENVKNFNDILKIEQWNMGNIAYLLERLNSIKDPDGSTVLENTLILVGHDTANIHTAPSPNHNKGAHKSRRDPMFLMGGRNFAFPTGRYILTQGKAVHGGERNGTFTPHQRLLVSIANLFGGNVSKFGSADPGSGELSVL